MRRLSRTWNQATFTGFIKIDRIIENQSWTSVANSFASAPLRFEVYAINKEGESPPVQVRSAPVAKHKDYFQASILNNLLVRLPIQEYYQLLRILILVWASEGGGPLQAAKRAEGAG